MSINGKKKKILFICFLVLPLLLTVFPVGNLIKPSLIIFPDKNIGNRISALNDKNWNGKSQIEKFAFDNQAMRLKYILKEGAASPMVFITLYISTFEKALDLSQFDSISLYIKEATCKRIMLFIKTNEPGFSLPEPYNAQTLRHNQYILQLVPGNYQYTIKFKEFITPPWWIELVKANAKELPKESFRKVITFDMQFNQAGSDYKINIPESITIEKIAFNRSISIPDLVLAGILILYYMGITGFLIIRKLQGREPLPPQKPIKVSSYRKNELIRIKEFIEAHYHDPDISTPVIYKKLGIPQNRVFNLIKEEYHLTFKQLINKMRIKEAKRLLKETDLRIIDIAFNLGFNSISYFNNLFKMYEGQTPTDYREKSKK